eukprot:scaffold1475_cov147-Isochrysis_galbana.AAC.1
MSTKPNPGERKHQRRNGTTHAHMNSHRVPKKVQNFGLKRRTRRRSSRAARARRAARLCLAHMKSWSSLALHPAPPPSPSSPPKSLSTSLPAVSLMAPLGRGEG